jgi:hypothetical protein
VKKPRKLAAVTILILTATLTLITTTANAEEYSSTETSTVEEVPAPEAWSPPEGWKQPKGWAVVNDGATYLPCSNVVWHFNRENEGLNRSKMVKTTQTALKMISAKTGLTFTQTKNVEEAELTFNWERSNKRWAGLGGGYGWNSNRGEVTFNSTNWWTEDSRSGFAAGQRGGSGGNGWLVIHEVLHALGLGHVDNMRETMNPVSTVSAFGPGTIRGLNEMYKSQPCPVSPPEVVAS